MILKLVKNVEIQSALIWAAVILSCSFFTADASVVSILITAAGFHTVLLAYHNQSKSCSNV